MKKQSRTIGHGFLPDKIKEEDYVLGGYQLPQDVLQGDGQWDDVLPDIEKQKRNGLETMNCVSYGTLNCIETLIKKLYGEDVNYSERYIGVTTGTDYWGNSPQNVIEGIRKEYGVIEEELLPFDDEIKSWDEYYSPKPMRIDYLRRGEKWLERYEIKHEWVFTILTRDKKAKIKEALKYSPIGVSVITSGKNNKGYYIKREDEEDNHWVMLYGYKDGEYWKIFDHYDDVFKKIDWDYDFSFAKRYYIKRKKEDKRSALSKLVRVIKWYISELLK